MADHIDLQHLGSPDTPARQERAMGTTTSAGRSDPGDLDGVFRAELPADLTSARQVRSAVRAALAAWGMDDPHGDTELLASELVANAAEHAVAGPISLALRRHREPSGQPAITCEVTDTSPVLPQARQAQPADERGRGLAILTALATDSGVRAAGAGKTCWFTLALSDRIERSARQAVPEAEAGA